VNGATVLYRFNGSTQARDAPMTDKCFMIQPFDGGKFDKRFDEVFKPAVTAAGLEPYRVDRDPGASIPIEDIETGIRQSAVCLADVTLDNPNVWFELGFAIAVGKDICIVSSEERLSKYPFDIQHRKIIKYKVESPSDYANLGKQIEERVKALLEQQRTRANIPSVTSGRKASTEFQAFELSYLACLGMEARSPRTESWVSVYIMKTEMEKLGFNNLAANVALRNLTAAGFVDIEQVEFDPGERGEACHLTPLGWDWVTKNIGSLNLKTKPKKGFDRPVDDEIPF
jgi:hypothetical protein